MKKPSCNCFQGDEIKFISVKESDLTAPNGYKWTWNHAEDLLNFCPVCGTPYVEVKNEKTNL